MNIENLSADQVIDKLAKITNLGDEATIGQLKEAATKQNITVAKLVEQIKQEQCDAPHKPISEMSNDELRKVQIVDLFEPLAKGGYTEHTTANEPIYRPAEPLHPFIRNLDAVLQGAYGISTVGELFDKQKKDLVNLDNIINGSIKAVQEGRSSDTSLRKDPLATRDVRGLLDVIEKSITIDKNIKSDARQENDFYNKIRELAENLEMRKAVKISLDKAVGIVHKKIDGLVDKSYEAAKSEIAEQVKNAHDKLGLNTPSQQLSEVVDSTNLGEQQQKVASRG